jgi:hypothetical protein
MSMLLFVPHKLWSIIDDSGSVVSSVVSSHPALLSFPMLAGNVDRARLEESQDYRHNYHFVSWRLAVGRAQKEPFTAALTRRRETAREHHTAFFALLV